MAEVAATPLGAAEFATLYEAVRNWGRWGAGDERGTLNLLTSDVVAAAAALAREGRSVSLAHDLDVQAGPDNTKPALHYMSQLSDVDAAEPKVNLDFVGVDYHGKSVTHLDALCHCEFHGRMYGDVDPAVVTSRGSAFGSVLTTAHGIVGRGVLLDVPRFRDVDWLEPGTAVTADELQEVAAAQSVEVRRGDIVLVRTGIRRRREALGAWDPSNFSAGLHATAMRWLHEREVAVLGSDGDNDARPSPVEGVVSPVHALALVAMGLPLVDNMNLEDVAPVCEELRRWEFLWVLAPLRIPQGTGSPANPIAVF